MSVWLLRNRKRRLGRLRRLRSRIRASKGRDYVKNSKMSVRWGYLENESPRQRFPVNKNTGMDRSVCDSACGRNFSFNRKYFSFWTDRCVRNNLLPSQLSFALIAIYIVKLIAALTPIFVWAQPGRILHSLFFFFFLIVLQFFFSFFQAIVIA